MAGHGWSWLVMAGRELLVASDGEPGCRAGRRQALPRVKHRHVPSSRTKGVFGHSHVRRRADPGPWVVALVRSMISCRLRAVLAQTIDERRSSARVDCDAAMADGLAHARRAHAARSGSDGGATIRLPPRRLASAGRSLRRATTFYLAGSGPTAARRATTQSASPRVWPMPRRATVCAAVRTAPPNGASLPRSGSDERAARVNFSCARSTCRGSRDSRDSASCSHAALCATRRPASTALSSAGCLCMWLWFCI